MHATPQSTNNASVVVKKLYFMNDWRSFTRPWISFALERCYFLVLFFIYTASVNAQFLIKEKVLNDEELLKLKKEIKRSSGRQKFDKLVRLTYHLTLRVDADTAELNEYVKEAERTVKSLGDDPYLEIRLDWMRTFGNPEKFKQLASKIIRFYENSDPRRNQREDTLIYAAVLHSLGQYYSALQQPESLKESARYHYKALHLYEALGDSSWIKHQYGTLGAVHLITHNYEDAVRYTLAAIRYGERTEEERSANLSLRNNLALMYFGQKKFREALETFEYVAKEYRNLNRNYLHDVNVVVGATQFMVNASMAAMNLGDTALLSENIRDLRQWLDEHPSDYYSAYLTLFEMGEAFLRNDDALGERKYRALKEILPKAKAWRAAGVADMVMGKHAMKNRQFQPAARAFQSALSHPELPLKIYLEQIYRGAADAYYALQRYDSAYYFIRQEMILRDSIAKIADEYRGMELLHRYQSDALKESLRNATLENQRHRFEKRWAWGTAIFIGFVVLVLAPVLWKLWKTQKRVKRINLRVRKHNETITRQKKEIQIHAEALQSALEAKDRLDKFKENMTQLVVHDLKSPLNVVLGFAEMSSDETTKRYVSAAGQKMLTLVLTLLDVSKFESDSLKPHLTNVALGDMIASAREHIFLELETKQIRFETTGPNVVVRADKQLLYRILVNLFTNAVKYTPPGGKITVDVEVEGERVGVSVSDTGPGIPEEFLPQLFDRFTTGGKNLGRTPSTGLGLYFCKLAVEAHGGKIRALSRVGEGTTFTFDLELVSVNEKAMVDAEKTMGEKPPLSPEIVKTLEPFLEKLMRMEVYETTQILAVVDEIPPDGAEIERWKSEVRNAVFNCNAEAYTRLVKMG